MKKVILLLAVYEIEDYGIDKEIEVIEGVYKTFNGAIKRLLYLVDNRPYEEYRIKKYYLGD